MAIVRYKQIFNKVDNNYSKWKENVISKNKGQNRDLGKRGTTVAQHMFWSWSCEERLFVGFFDFFFFFFFTWASFSWKRGKNQLHVSLHMPDVTVRSNPTLGKELLHREFDFKKAKTHCLQTPPDTNKCWH